MPHNVSIYVLHPAEWGGRFPFVHATAVRGGPEGYLGAWNEGVAGFALTLPALWLLLALPLAWRASPAATMSADGPAEIAGLRAMIASIALYGSAVTAVMLAYFLATPRYAADFAPALGLLAMLGLLGAERWAQGMKRRLLRTAALGAIGVVCVATCVVGVSLSLDYHDRLARRMAPEQWGPLERFFGGVK